MNFGGMDPSRPATGNTPIPINYSSYLQISFWSQNPTPQLKVLVYNCSSISGVGQNTTANPVGLRLIQVSRVGFPVPASPGDQG